MPHLPRTAVHALAALVVAVALLAVAPSIRRALRRGVAHRGQRNGQGAVHPVSLRNRKPGRRPDGQQRLRGRRADRKRGTPRSEVRNERKRRIQIRRGSEIQPTGSTREEAAPIEGLAVDPAMHRVYVLALNESESTRPGRRNRERAVRVLDRTGRRRTAAGDRHRRGGPGRRHGVLIPPSKGFEKRCIEPRGIAVEPIDQADRVVLLGLIDTGKKTKSASRSCIGGLAGRRHRRQRRKTPDRTALRRHDRRARRGSLLPRRLQQKTLRAGRRRDLRNSCLRPPETVHALDAGTHRMVGRTQPVANPVDQEPLLGAGMSVGPEGTFWASAGIKLASEKNFKPAGAVWFDQTGQVLGWSGQCRDRRRRNARCGSTASH